MKEFAKETIVNNLYYLIKIGGKKIGEVEIESGVSTGYISRMGKDINAKPGIDFIVRVADVLNISIDTLLGVDLTKLSRTEQYALAFIQKLKKNTEAEKLIWEKDDTDELNNNCADDDGYPKHPLFTWETFTLKNDVEGSSEEVTRMVFNSHSFGCNTWIHGDCYKIEMKYNTFLYLMDIQKNERVENIADDYAKEIWLYKPGVGGQYLCGNKDLNFSKDVDYLFSSVTEYLKHPQLKSEFRDAIDAFMNEEFSVGSNNEEFSVGSNVSQGVPFDEEVPF